MYSSYSFHSTNERWLICHLCWYIILPRYWWDSITPLFECGHPFGLGFCKLFDIVGECSDAPSFQKGFEEIEDGFHHSDFPSTFLFDQCHEGLNHFLCR